MNDTLSILFSGDLKLFHVCFTYIIPYMVYFFCSFVLILVFIKVLICSNHYHIVIYFMMPLVLFLIKWVSTFYFIIFTWYPWLSLITCVIISEVILLSHISTFMEFIKFKFYWLVIFPSFILVTIVKYIYCWA